jgi:hypothetical protein
MRRFLVSPTRSVVRALSPTRERGRAHAHSTIIMFFHGRAHDVAFRRARRIGLNPARNRVIEIVKCPTSLARRAQSQYA